MSIIQPKSVTIDGVVYESYAQADRALGLAKGTTGKRIAREKAQAAAEQEKDILPAIDARQVDGTAIGADIDHPDEANEQRLPDQAEMSENENSRPAIAPVSGGDEQDGEVPVSPDYPKDDQDEKVLEYEGVVYDTRKQMADALELDYLKLNAYLRKYDDVQQAVEKCLSGETAHSITYEGTMYKSFKALCEAHTIAPAIVRQVAAAHDTDKMEAFSDLVALREMAEIREDITLTCVPAYVLEGVPFKSEKEMAGFFDIPPDELADHITQHGVLHGLHKLQALQTTGYAYEQGGPFITIGELMEKIENGELEHIDLERKQIPLYPKLKGIDVDSHCLDLGEIRDTIGSGEFAADYYQDDGAMPGLVMGGM